jgi:hypothetical protein
MPIDFFLNVFTTYVSAVLIIFGSSVNIVQPLVGFPMAVLVLFVEVPFCLKCCPTGPNFDKFMLKFNSNPLRALLYFILSLIIWLVVNPGGVVMGVLPGLSLTAAFVCYSTLINNCKF